MAEGNSILNAELQADIRENMMSLAVGCVRAEMSKDKPLDNQKVLALAKEWSDFCITGEYSGGKD